MKKYFYLLLLGLLGMMQNVSSQCRTEVFGTDFRPADGAPSPYYNLSSTLIREWKEDGNNIAATLTPRVGYATAATQVGATGGGYGVVRMPSDVNNNYANTPSANKPMIIFPFGSTNYADLLSFEITGLDRNESYAIKIDAVLVYRGTGCPNGNNGTFNLFGIRNDLNGTRENPATFSAQPLANGYTQTYTMTAQSTADGRLSFTLLSGTSTNAGCIVAIGFNSVTVTGCPPIRIEEPGPPDPCPMLTNNPPSSCDVVSATIFESTEGEWESDIHDISTAKFIGMQGTLSIPRYLPGNAATSALGTKTNIGLPNATGRVYAVVDNPYRINSNFPNINKPMILLPSHQAIGSQRAAMLQYSVSGLNPGTAYDIVIEGYYITSECTSLNGAPALTLGFGVDVNGNPIGQSGNIMPGNVTPTVADPVKCFTATHTYTTPTASFEMQLKLDYNGVTGGGTNCRHFYGITKIEIKGRSTTRPATIPRIISNQGQEVCRNELVRFSLDRNYDACTYKWEKAPTATGPWQTVGDRQNYLEEVSQNAFYRCTINDGRAGGYGVSDMFELTVIECCNESDGGSRITLLHDDFGEFLSSALYKTVDGRIIPTCNGQRKTIMDPVPAVRPAYGTPNMPGVVFLAGFAYQPTIATCIARTMGDVVICALPDMNDWYTHNQLGNVDADGNANGGVLFIDVADRMLGEVYRRPIEGLCPGKKTYFQVDFAPGSTGAATTDRITLAIYAKNADGSKGAELATTGELRNFPVRWQTLKLDFEVPEGIDAVYLSIELAYTDHKSAGEFFLDNVKFMVCSQPHIEAYSNVETLQQDTIICGDGILKFGTKINEKIMNAYGGEDQIRAIYQRSIDGENWENVTGIVSNLSMNLDMSGYPGTTNYFRMVVAEEAALQKFLTNPNAETFANACRTTSVSRPFMVYREGNLNMGADETFNECKGVELTLNGTTIIQEPQIAQWEWVNESGTVLVGKSSDAAKRDYTHIVNGSDIIYFVGYNRNGCSARKKFIINENAKVTITLTETKVCGQTTVTATSVPATGVTYSWQYTNGVNISTTGPSIVLDIPNYANGTVSVTGTATGYCVSDEVKRDITINAKPSAPTATTSLPYPVEPGNANVSTDANVQYTAGNNLYWRDAAGNLLTPPVLQSKTVAGTYIFWVGQVSPDGCRSDSIQITVIISAVAPPEVRDTSICEGESINLSVLAQTTEPGGSLVWYTSADGGTGSATAPSLTNPAPGDHFYYVTQKIGSDESERTPIKITVVALPIVDIINNTGVTELTCTNPEIRLVATGGGTYSWSGGLGNDANATVNSPGNYTVTVTIGRCENSKTINITENKTDPTVAITNHTAVTELTCTNPEISLTATGGVSYSWSGGLGNSANATVTTSGAYVVTVTGSNGCTATASITITEDKTKPTAGITNNTGTVVLTCTNPEISLTATGEGTYQWSNGQSGANLTVTEAGNYTVTVTATNGCTNTASITITIDDSMPIVGITNNTGTTELTCTKPEISLTATGGGTYQWSNGQSGANLTVTESGDYTVTVTADNGCIVTESITISINKTPPTAGITNNSGTTVLTCAAPTISLTATGGGTYSWSNGLGSNANVTVRTAGTYTVTVTAANGCTDTESITITTDGSRPTAGITNNTGVIVSTCTTPSISLTATGGATYSWDKGLGGNANATVTSAGTYTVTVTDTNGCTDTESITITENKAEPNGSITNNSGTTVLTCAKPSISLTATGGVSYLWSNGDNTANTTITTPGAYVVTVTGSNGCTGTRSITITADESIPTIVITTNPETTVLTCTTPSITLTASGGVSYSWNNGGNSASITVTLAGTYTVDVTSANGCSTTKSIEITSNQHLPVVKVNNSEICLSYEAILTASGADSYTWTTSETGTTITVSPTATTTYTVEGVIDATGCKNTAIATVYVESPIGLTLDAPKSVELGNELTITVTAERTDHGYFEWFINDQPYKTVSEYNLTLVPDAGRQHFLVHTATAKLNCPSSSEIYVEVSESVPNAINPYDPSGRNCCFMRGYRVEIYNRYMQKIFEGSDGWDGTYRGALADPGTYFYRVYKKGGQVEKGTLEVVKF